MSDATIPSSQDTIGPTLHASTGRPLADLSELFDQPGEVARLEHYVLLGKLGQGGMGVVFAAYDEKLDRKVAIKVLSHAVGEEGRLRLVREAQALARISHPNVVQIHEIGEHRGLTFIVMEHLQGITLRSWLRETKRELDEILAVVGAAGRGLAAAHARGLVHRDFKPDNVIVGEQGRVWVLDFGLAREHASAPADRASVDRASVDRASVDRASVDRGELSSSSSALSSQLTREGSLLGTPIYMAPEQFSGAEVDARSDQFSFSVVLWEAVYGERPFVAESVEGLALAVTTGAIQEPARKDAPSGLRTILDRGLQIQPEDRWPSLDAMLDELARRPRHRVAPIFAGLAVVAVLAAAASSVARDRAQAEAEAKIDATCLAHGAAIEADWNSAVEAELGEAFAGVGLGMAASAWAHTQAPVREYVAQWSQLRTRVCRETELTGERSPAKRDELVACLDMSRAGLRALVEVWSEPDEQVVIAAPMAVRRLTQPSACFDPRWASLQVQPPDELAAPVRELRGRLAQAQAWARAGRRAQARDRELALLADAEALGWLPLVAEARLGLGASQARLADYEGARASLELASLEAAGSRHDTIILDAASELVFVIGSEQSDFEGSRYWSELGRRYVDRLGLAGTVREAELLNSQGTRAAAASHYDEALELHEAALAIREASLGPEHPLTADSRVNVGQTYSDLGRRDEALASYERALAIYRETLGPEHLHVSYALNNIANVYQAQDRHEEALDILRESLRIREAALDPQHPRLISSLNNLGNAFWHLGELDAALETYERAVAIIEAADAPMPTQLGSLMVGLGLVYQAQGRSEDALAAQRRALELLEGALGPDHAHLATILVNMGDVLLELGRDDEALAAQRRALSIAEAARGPDHASVGFALVGIGRSLERQGELSEARAGLERALLIFAAGGSLEAHATARFTLGRILHAQGERVAGRELVEDAGVRVRELGPSMERELAEIEAWLRDNP